MATNAVVDSSVILSSFTIEERSDWATEKLSEGKYFHILDLSYYEVANGLKTKSKRGELEKKIVLGTFTRAVNVMSLYTSHQFSEIIAEALIIALEMDIALYDSAMVALAYKLDCPLITLDKKLVAALKNTKYEKIIDSPY